jgi:hypothetical protein
MLNMSKHPTFKDVLKEIMNNPVYRLEGVDSASHHRKFFEEWRDNKTDVHLWESIAADAERRGLSLSRRHSYYRIAAIAAQAILFDGDDSPSMSPDALRERSEYLLGLAESAAALADYYRAALREDSEYLTDNTPPAFRVFSGREAQRLIDAESRLRSDEVPANEKLARLYSEEEKRFRLQSDDMLEVLQNVSRQRRGKKFSREHLTFMRSLAGGMRREFGSPYYEACAALTNLAYPRMKVVATAGHVRLAYRAKSGTGKLKRK